MTSRQRAIFSPGGSRAGCILVAELGDRDRQWRKSMTHVYLLCGLAFAGKSTLGRRLVERTDATLLSLDDINAERGLHGGTGIPAEEWMKTHREALARLAALLAQGLSVVVDDTNCFRWLRDDYRAVADRWSVPVTVVYLDLPLDLVLQRTRENDVSRHRPVVTEEILRELARTFEAPGPDERVVEYRSPEPVEEWIERWF